VKLLLSILVAGTCATLCVSGQEATDVDFQPHQSGQNSRAAPTPPDIQAAPAPAVPELSQIDEIFKQTSLGKEADERRLHMEWRQLANQVINDSEVLAVKRSAETARTDLEKRERLRTYYNIYYNKMRALASSAEMKAALDHLKSAHLSQINQPRVRPSTDSSLPTPTPSPRKHRASD
jgi:hypothetical protein